MKYHLFVTAPQLGCSAGQGEGAEEKKHLKFWKHFPKDMSIILRISNIFIWLVAEQKTTLNTS